MSFTWPLMLLSLAVVPVLVAAYLSLTRRRDAAAAELGLRLTDSRGAGRPARRRHVASAIFLAAIALLLISLARPKVVLALPHLEGTVLLAFDVSTSMKADDLKPTRLDAAKRAASAFVREQPSTIKIGVVAFSDNALVMLQPTNVEDDVLAAIDRLAPQGGTSLSEGMFASLGVIAGKAIALPPDATADDLLSMDIGHFGSAVVVMLTDGEHTSRVDPRDVAEVAAGAGVRVFPIGLGKPEGTTLTIDGYRISTALNEPLLKEIATTTDGAYLRAEDEAQLLETYRKINLRLTTAGKDTEVTSVVAGAAMLLLFTGSLLTIRWFGRVP
ncbi:MAG: VWA domain-containing protein [Dehalococcoidia bacterium]